MITKKKTNTDLRKANRLKLYNQFRFSGYFVEENINIESSNTFGFSFKNTGTQIVTINGIELQANEEFNEPLLALERSYGNYVVKFGRVALLINKLRVIEKFPII